jgi:small nuclear ribonucleoprotein (snRNP)-like protein
MNENNFWTDHKDIELEVTLKSGRVPLTKLKCFYLRTYDGQLHSCDAHAFIYANEINNFLDNCSGIVVVTRKDFFSFKDQGNQKWVISNCKKIIQDGQLDHWVFCLIRA